MTIRLKVMRRVRYDGKLYHPGNYINADNHKEAELLIAMRKVKEAPLPKEVAVKPVNAAKPKPAAPKESVLADPRVGVSGRSGQYDRRDLTAKEPSK